MVYTPDLLNDPLGIAAVTIAVVAALYWQRGLGWRDYQAIQKAKITLAPLVDRLPSVVDRFPPIFVLSEKAYRNKSPEFLGTRDSGVRAVYERLCESGSPHLVSSVKARTNPQGRREYARAHVVWTHDDQTQTEAVLFDNGDGTTDVYAHLETSVSDVDGHLEEGGTPGDPRGVVRGALGIGAEV
jgi:hypothetical protein